MKDINTLCNIRTTKKNANQTNIKFFCRSYYMRSTRHCQTTLFWSMIIWGSNHLFFEIDEKYPTPLNEVIVIIDFQSKNYAYFIDFNEIMSTESTNVFSRVANFWIWSNWNCYFNLFLLIIININVIHSTVCITWDKKIL